jgi:desulfoferrodoxin (superoxide reductase-like protein)
MGQNMKTLIIILTIFFFINCISACSDKKETAEIKEIPKFHTYEKEGYWKDKGHDHVPIITFINKEEGIIEVVVPLKPTKKPRHYIEVIALMQGEKNQVEAKKFKYSFEKAKAQFKLPDPEARDYWIMVKCNLHDMWKEAIPFDDMD